MWGSQLSPPGAAGTVLTSPSSDMGQHARSIANQGAPSLGVGAPSQKRLTSLWLISVSPLESADNTTQPSPPKK